MGSPEIVALLSLMLLLFGWRHLDTLVPRFVHAIEEIKNHWGGGPRPPSHPLPGSDAVVVNRRRSRQ